MECVGGHGFGGYSKGGLDSVLGAGDVGSFKIYSSIWVGHLQGIE